MSLADWGKFAIDQMRGRRGAGRLLRAESYRFLHTPVGKGSAAGGWGVLEHPFGTLLLHTGSNGAWFAVTALAPDLLNAVVAAANAEDGGGAAVADHAVKLVTSRWRR